MLYNIAVIFSKCDFSKTSRVVRHTKRHVTWLKWNVYFAIEQKMVEILETALAYFNTKIKAFYRIFKHVQMTCPSRSHSLVLIPIFFVNFLK